MPEFEGRLFGFPIRVGQGVFILAGVYLLLGLGQGATPQTVVSTVLFVAIIFPSILLHELGHAFVTRWLGLGPAAIEIHGMGGTTIRTKPGTTWETIMVTAAGPGAGLMLGIPLALAYAFMPDLPPLGAQLMRDLVWVNVGWSLLNLLPILPLDGGMLLMSFVTLVAPRWALAVAGTVGLLLAASIAVWGLWVDVWFAMLAGAFLAYRNWQVLKTMRAGGGGPQRVRG